MIPAATTNGAAPALDPNAVAPPAIATSMSLLQAAFGVLGKVVAVVSDTKAVISGGFVNIALDVQEVADIKDLIHASEDIFHILGHKTPAANATTAPTIAPTQG